MTQITPIKPFVTEEGIELYATDTETGMSQIGLSRFAGQPETSLRRLLTQISDRQNPPSDCLNAIHGKELTITIPLERGGKPALIVKAEVCAAICEYYAFEKNNEIAKFSYRKFAKLGIESWIRQTTGHTIAALDPAQAALQLAMQLVETQKQLIDAQADASMTKTLLIESTEAKQIRDSFISQGDGLKMMFDEFETTDESDYPCPDQVNGIPRKYSIKEYLLYVQEVDLATVGRGTLSGYGRKVADTFKTHQIAEPEERHGKKGGLHKVYSKADFPILATAWESYRRERAIENIKKLG